MTAASRKLVTQDQENALKCSLAADTLRSFGLLRLRVTGQSMLPSIWPGDTLVIEQCDCADILPGDVVLYSRRNRLFAHRVVCIIDARGKPRFITQGDALPRADAPVVSSEVLGRATAIIREGRRIRPLTKPTVAARCVARVLRYTSFLSRLLVHLRTQGGNSAECEGLCQV